MARHDWWRSPPEKATETSELHPEKASSSIAVTPSGISTEVSELQPLKALRPIPGLRSTRSYPGPWLCWTESPPRVLGSDAETSEELCEHMLRGPEKDIIESILDGFLEHKHNQKEELLEDVEHTLVIWARHVERGAARGGERLTFEGSPYLSSLSFTSSVRVGIPSVIISRQGLWKSGCFSLDTFVIAQTLQN